MRVRVHLLERAVHQQHAALLHGQHHGLLRLERARGVGELGRVLRRGRRPIAVLPARVVQPPPVRRAVPLHGRGLVLDALEERLERGRLKLGAANALLSLAQLLR